MMLLILLMQKHFQYHLHGTLSQIRTYHHLVFMVLLLLAVFTYCATSIHMRDQYQPSQRIVAYFAFTKLGIAIPLRPGDVLFFNPLEEHCISSRCCNDDDIYCLSLYLKSDNIGLNDNSKELTPQQEYLLNVYNNN